MSKRKQKVNKGTLRRVLELIRPYAGLVVLTLVLAVVTVVTTLLAPVISGKAVDHIIGPGQVDFGGVGKLAIAMAGTVACTGCLAVVDERGQQPYYLPRRARYACARL